MTRQTSHRGNYDRATIMACALAADASSAADDNLSVAVSWPALVATSLRCSWLRAKLLRSIKF